MKSKKSYLSANIKKLKNSEIEIEVEIGLENLNNERGVVFEKIRKDAEIPGFRKGQAPEAMIIKKVGEMAILKEAAELCIGQAYEDIITDNKIDAIGKPEVVITKLAPNNSLCFKIKTVVLPEITLGNYTKIAKQFGPEKEKIEVNQKEVEEVLNQIRNPEKTPGEENVSPKNDLPPLTDEFAKSLGLKDLNDLKEKIKENLKQQKLVKAKGKRRMSIVDEIAKSATIDLPFLLVESELQKMMAEFQDRVENSGLSFKDYLTNAKTTEEKMREEWKPQAEKKAKVQLILNKIAEDQKITADPKKLESEMKLIMEQYPKANKESAKIFIETILTNEAVFEFLEKLST
ncbi:MAG: trigger factor [Patescibacteria group bacterium]